MKTLFLKLVLGTILAYVTWAATAMAATEAEKLTAIQNGLAHLASTQQSGGYWIYGGYEPAATGAAVLAFVSQKDKWGVNTANYQTAVDNAVAYLLSVATKVTVSIRNDGTNICPGGSGTCDGVFWLAANGEDSYTTGLIMPALMTYAAGKAGDVATTIGPLAGMTWGQIAQANINLWAASQSTANQGNRQGGWRYILGVGGYDSDMSTTQWGIISLIYDQTLGATTPAIVKTDLATWLAFAQDPPSGAGCYQGPSSGICDHSDTGGLLVGLQFVGKTTGDLAVQKALSFLNTNWTQTASGTWYGNFGHPYAMWSVYKGLEVNIGLKDTTTITNLLLTTCGAPNNLPGNPPGSVPCNWWEDYNEWLVRNQNGDGSWSGYAYWGDPLSTAFDVNILGATPIPVGNQVLDNFNRATSNKPIPITDSSWPYWSGATGIKQYDIEGFLENGQWNGKVEPDGSLPIYWNKTAFGVSQEAFVTLSTVDPAGTENDLLLKVQASGTGVINYKKGYIEVWYSPKAHAVRVDTLLPNASSWTIYTPDIPVTFNNGDKFGARALADGTVHIYKNGSEVGVVTLNAKDQAFFNSRGGYIGLWFIGSPNAYFDDFGGGNV